MVKDKYGKSIIDDINDHNNIVQKEWEDFRREAAKETCFSEKFLQTFKEECEKEYGQRH